MNRVGLWAVGIGVFASVGLLTGARGSADENEGTPKCTLATLKGAVSVRWIGNAVPPSVWGNRDVGRQRRRISYF
jgi:hypothetical protein